MKRLKSTKLLAALLLVGVCVLGVALIVHAIDFEVIFEDDGFPPDHPHSEWISISEENQTVSCYIYGSFWIEDEENGDYTIGSVHAQGAAWINADGTVTLFSYAYSYLSDPDRAGEANAWIKFPREPLISHKHPDKGPDPVGAGADKMGVQVYDTRTFQQGDNNAWGWLKGGASLKVKPDLGRISVKFEARAKKEEE